MASKEELRKLSDKYHEERTRQYKENLLYYMNRERQIQDSAKAAREERLK